MTRVPERELMTSEPQASAYATADLSELHEPIVAAFAARFGAVSGRMLDLGCGAADMAIRFARAYPRLDVLGVDGADAMLAHGRRAVREAGLDARIRLVRQRLDSLPVDSSFDVVIANSVLHHVTNPAVLWSAILHSARGGAVVMVADLHRPADVDEAERFVNRFADGAHPVVRSDFFNSLCAAYTADEVAGQLRDAGLDGYEVQRLGELHVVAWGRA